MNARERWSRLLYCSWDDIIFMRGDREYDQPENMAEFLARASSLPPAFEPHQNGAAERTPAGAAT